MTETPSSRNPSLARWSAAGALTSLAALGCMIALWATTTAVDGVDDESGLGWALAGISAGCWVLLCLGAAALLRGARWRRGLPFIVSVAWCSLNAYATLARLPGSLPLLPAPLVLMVVTGFTIPAAAVLFVVALIFRISVRDGTSEGLTPRRAPRPREGDRPPPRR